MLDRISLALALVSMGLASALCFAIANALAY